MYVLYNEIFVTINLSPRALYFHLIILRGLVARIILGTKKGKSLLGPRRAPFPPFTLVRPCSHAVLHSPTQSGRSPDSCYVLDAVLGDGDTHAKVGFKTSRSHAGSSHLHVQGRHFGSWRLAVLGVSTPWKLVKAIKQVPSKPPKSTLLKAFAPVGSHGLVGKINTK